MPDFLKIHIDTESKGGPTACPIFLCGGVKDIMVKGGRFYAAWDEDNKIWITDWNKVPELIDREIDRAIDEASQQTGYSKPAYRSIKYARLSSTKVMNEFKNFVENQMTDNYKQLDHKLIFKSDPYERDNYSTIRLPYDVQEGETPAFDKLFGVLYSEEERRKWMWAIGSVLTGDSLTRQKFLVFYGDPGCGKGTVLDLIQMLFNGYSEAFNVSSVTSGSDQFALASFRTNPLVAIDPDGDMSKVSDNTKLNSIVSHERMTINEKHKQQYSMKVDSMLFIASNKRIKITDMRSGLLRRLIDVNPTGETLPRRDYMRLTGQLKFELGAIAAKCIAVFEEDPDIYEGYRPVQQLIGTNDMYNFVMENREQLMSEPYIPRKLAYEWYRKYCEEAGVPYPLKLIDFGEELRHFFHEFRQEYRDREGRHRSFVYIGFKNDLYDEAQQDKKIARAFVKMDIFEGLPEWLKLKTGNPQLNQFNKECASCHAQFASAAETPRKAWSDVKEKLTDIMTTQLHYVKVPLNHIVIDLDIKDPKTGKKSLELCIKKVLELGLPPTYVETSKSGNGLHLHYIYNGDPTLLDSYYHDETHDEPNVEIKVFKGKSSLRRRLSLCNNEPIAHIGSGLPLKEINKKVVSEVFDEKGFKDEQHLRNSILKGLRKEVHDHTKPSIDYIKYTLDIAYNSGMVYDVADLRPAITDFAASATNQAALCLEIVQTMHFSSEERAENHESKVYLEKPVAFYDVEVFPNLFVVCYKVKSADGAPVRKEDVKALINPTALDIYNLVHDYRLIGFNNTGYDNYILQGRMNHMTNDELYDLSRRIIGSDDSRSVGMYEAKNLSYTDIYDFANTKQSLKKWEIDLDIHHQELRLRWDQPVPEELWDEVADYCKNDVVATEILFSSKKLRGDWIARQVVAKVSGMTVNDSTNNHSTRIIFGKDRNPQSSFPVQDLSKEFPGYEFSPFGIDVERYSKGPDGKPVCSKSHKSIFMGDDPSEGGYVYTEPGMYYNVALLDIASLHPTTIDVLNLFGPYTDKFREIKACRIAVKHKDWEKARVYLNGALASFLEGIEDKDEEYQQQMSDDLAYALKIIINSVYGLTSAGFKNPFKAPHNIDNVVAKRGALFMIKLKHELQDKGITVCHIKTDSIKIPNATPEIIKFVMDFGQKYGYTFEHEATYAKMCLVNKAVYIAKYDEYGERTKGGRHANCWTATGTEFDVKYVFKTLFSHEDITFKDLCETKSVSGGGAIYLDFDEPYISRRAELEGEIKAIERRNMVPDYDNLTPAGKPKKVFKPSGDDVELYKQVCRELENTHEYIFVGRCGLFCPIQEGHGGATMLREADGKYSAVAGTKGYRWLEAEEVKERGYENYIDRSYYDDLVKASFDHIGEYGDAKAFIES